MQATRFNEWLQLIASAGVIIGLLAVAYEVRETNRIATGESIRGIYEGFSENDAALYAADMADLYARAFESPRDFSTAEMAQLNAYLINAMRMYNMWVDMNTLGVARYDGVEDLIATADVYFGSEYGRAWYYENQYWFRPPMSEALDSYLEGRPILTMPPDIAGIKRRLEEHNSGIR